MAKAFIFFIFLQSLLYAICYGEACAGNWSTDTTRYTTLNFKENSYVHVSCKHRLLKVDGEHTIRCVGGQLPTYLPQCVLRKESCIPLKAPVFGSMKCSTKAPEVGSSCTFECQSTHYLKGSRTRYCIQDPRWTGIEARCIIKSECPVPPPLHQGTVTGCSPERKPRYNDTCYFRCNGGFRLVGPSHLKCRLHGKLTDERGRQRFPKCDPIVPVNPSESAVSSNEDFQNRPRPIPPTSWLSCQVRNGYCSHNCHQEPKGIRCSCRSGYRLASDGRACIETFSVYPYSNVAVTTGDVDFRSTPHSVSPPSWLSCDVRKGYCSHNCHQEPGGVRCSCRSGYQLAPNGRTCTEMVPSMTLNPGGEDFPNTSHPVSPTSRFSCQQHNGYCSHNCHQEPKGIRCSCRSGYRLASDGRTCTDVDECLEDELNKCDHACRNSVGGYICSCREGFVSPDGFKCEGCRVNSYRNAADVSCKECPANSYTDGEEKRSINDCFCNPGFTGNLAQGIPCTDIDECSVKNGGCDGTCHNTVGNFSCSCPRGYVASLNDRYSCDDVDECAEGNGGCSDECLNFQGGFHCFCSEGYHLHPDGRSCIPVHCLRVFVPHHSTLRCKNNTSSKDKDIFKPGEMPEDKEFPVGATCRIKCDRGYDFQGSQPGIVCQNDGKWNGSLPECRVLQCPPLTPPSNGDVYPTSCKNGSSPVQHKCFFTCQPGYRITGQEMLKCRNNLTWAKKKPTQCVPETEVSISCPDDDIAIELMPDEGWAKLQLNSPRTTLTAGPIQVSPDWVHLDRASIFPAGETEVTFSVTRDNKTAECSISIIVLDKHPPVFPDCPDTLIVTSSLAGTVVSWEEPIPQDNVGIASISKSLEPNSTLSPGLHFVEYVARDFAGNVGQCIFYINVTATDGCKDLADPENGEANCQEWMFGKVCQPTCFDNYTRPPELFACDESGTWTPFDFISPCLPECSKDENWFPELQKCVKIP